MWCFPSLSLWVCCGCSHKCAQIVCTQIHIVCRSLPGVYLCMCLLDGCFALHCNSGSNSLHRTFLCCAMAISFISEGFARQPCFLPVMHLTMKPVDATANQSAIWALQTTYLAQNAAFVRCQVTMPSRYITTSCSVETSFAVCFPGWVGGYAHFDSKCRKSSAFGAVKGFLGSLLVKCLQSSEGLSWLTVSSLDYI